VERVYFLKNENPQKKFNEENRSRIIIEPEIPI